jgi:NAD-dependent dihydropyrimidine dehydrogenase PreA subunit
VRNLKIKEDRCIGCGQCVVVCPVQAIKLIDNKAVINKDLCVECSVCLRSANCPSNAIKKEKLRMPRLVRNPFSDVIATHKLTGVPGRGTEEMKTNDVTNRIRQIEIGFSIEIGRPGIGARLGVAEQFTIPLAKIGVEFEQASPLTALLADDKGHLQEDLKNEKVLSAIIEFKVPYDKTIEILDLIKKLDKEIDTVFSVGVISRFVENGEIPVLDLLNEKNFSVRPNAKINVGLGRA